MEAILESILSSLEGITPIEAESVVLPLILQFSTSAPSPEHARDIVVLLNHTNNSIYFLEGRPINVKHILGGLLSASKASVEAIPMVKVLGEGIDCSFYFLDFEIDEKAKETP